MNTKALALTLTLALSFSLIVGVQFVNMAKANPLLPSFYADISIQSPQNRTYNTEPIPLNFTVKTNHTIGFSTSYFYVLDEQDIQASVKVQEVQDDILENDFLAGHAVLPKLSDGSHNLTVFLGYVDLDGVIYRHIYMQNPDDSTILGSFYSTANFTVNTSPEPTPELEPISPALMMAIVILVAIGTIVLVVVICAGLLLYFKKRHRLKSMTILSKLRSKQFLEHGVL